MKQKNILMIVISFWLPTIAFAQSNNHERLIAKAQKCDWDVTWQQFASYQQCLNEVNSTYHLLTNRCISGANNQLDYYSSSGQAGSAIGSQMRKENCPFKYGSTMNACIAYCKLHYR